MPDNSKYEQYFNQYDSYCRKNNLGNKYLEYDEIIFQTKYYRVLFYCSLSSLSEKKIPFLIIPSIFNSPEILFLSRTQNFIQNLAKQGDIYLVEWLEIKDPSYLLDNYVLQIVEIVSKLNAHNINLIGHCLGGNLAIAVNILVPKIIKTLTLLSCPWDFSHLFHVKKLSKYLKLDSNIDDLSLIPRSYIQILFFLLNPNYFNIKLEKFFSLIDPKERDLTFRIENWLASGYDLSKATYNQIMNNLIEDNIFMNLQWQINGTIIDPHLIENVIYLVAGNNDKLVPKNSILSLHKLLKNSKLIEVDGGHISYLINNKLDDLYKEYKK